MNRTIKLALKLGFVGALLYFLVRKGFISAEATSHAFTQWQYILPAFGLLIVTNILGAVRWQWLLGPQGIKLSFGRTLQLSFIGYFFNIALPGAVSGDFVKAFYVAKEAPGLRARAFGSILFDRVAGLSALVIVAAGALMLDWDQLAGTPLLSAIQYLVILAAAGFVGFYAYLFLVKERHDPVLKVFQTLSLRFPKVGAIQRIYEGLRHYHNHRLIVLRVLLISLVIHCMVCSASILFAYALGDLGIPKLAAFVVVPLGLLVTAIPIMPAGIGTGHAAFGWLFHFLGSQRGADIYSLFAILQLSVGAIGGLVYLRFKAHESPPAQDSLGQRENAQV